jgi:hypothetical protein
LKKRRRDYLIITGLFCFGIMLLAGCSSQPKLGPKPDTYGMASQAWESKIVDEFRSWLEKLDAKQADVLKKKGEVIIPFAELKQADPVKAKLVSDFARTIDARREQSTGMIFESVPQEISFVSGKDVSGNAIAGQYLIVIQFVRGDKIALALSNPLDSDVQ